MNVYEQKKTFFFTYLWDFLELLIKIVIKMHENSKYKSEKYLLKNACLIMNIVAVFGLEPFITPV